MIGQRKRHLIHLLAASLVMLASDALACRRTPDAFIVPPEELISRTQRIALATVIRAELQDERRVLYTFRTDEPLKGKVDAEFQMPGGISYGNAINYDFDKHQQEAFWESPVGRLSHYPDCRIWPTFVVGATYLIFLDQPHHFKGFERIIQSDPKYGLDAWYLFVKKRVSD